MSKHYLDSIHNTYDPNELSTQGEGVILRISKSSFMLARQCLRKYWWNKVKFPDLRIPPTEAMIKGTFIHKTLEECYDNYRGEDDLTPLFPTDTEYDETIRELINLENQRLDFWGKGHFKPFSYEQKKMVYDPEFNVMMVGAWDGLVEHPEGGLCIVELKTGDLSTGKLSRVRRELCFYERMISLMGYEKPVTHIMVISSDCTNSRTAESVLKSGRKEVYLGDKMGITIIEKLGKRSKDAFKRDYERAINSLKECDWTPNWSDFFCGNYCDFHLSCDDELHGEGDNPTLEGDVDAS